MRMGTSASKGRNVIAKWARALRPASCFDFGTGRGAFGAELRRGAPSAVIEGCDVWAPTVAWHAAHVGDPYDRVHHGDVVEFVDYAQAFEAWGFGDVLEHVPAATAQQVLRRGLDARAAVLVSLPVGPWPQGRVYGNEHERHVWTFSPPMLAEWFGADAVRAVQVVNTHPNTREMYEDLSARAAYEQASTYIGRFWLQA